MIENESKRNESESVAPDALPRTGLSEDTPPKPSDPRHVVRKFAEAVGRDAGVPARVSATSAPGGDAVLSPTLRSRAALYLLLPIDPAKAQPAVATLRAFARAEGFTFTTLYAERPEDRGSRRSLKRLLARAHAKGLDAVCVLRLHDLARSPQKVAGLVSDLGVPVLSMGGVRLAPVDRVVAWLAAHGQSRSKRSKRSVDAKRKLGERIGAIRYGFRLAEDGRTIILDEREQATMREARALRATGHSLRGTAAVLHSLGYRSRAGTPITHRQVSRWLGRDGL